MTTITVTIPSWGHDVTRIETNLANPAAAILIDYGMGNDWEYTAYQAADMAACVEDFARILVAQAHHVGVDELPDDLEIEID